MRKPLPDKIQNAPQILLGLDLYYFAFLDLTADRRLGFGAGPIPWASRQLYAEKNDLSEEQTEDLHFFITTMDKAYLEYFEEKAKVKSK